jgi:hypothetical protein
MGGYQGSVAPFARIREAPEELSITGLDGSGETLRRIEPNQAGKTLGILMAIDGNETSQFVRMKTAAADWASVVKSSFLRQNNLLPMISATIQKTMEYPMVVTTFSRQKWDEVIRPILWVALPKAGVCHSFPREAVYGPRRYNGMGVQHPFVLQVSHHIDALLSHGPSDSLTGQFLRSNLECHQLEIGLPLGVFQNQFSDVGVLATNTWAAETGLVGTFQPGPSRGLPRTRPSTLPRGHPIPRPGFPGHKFFGQRTHAAELVPDVPTSCDESLGYFDG